MAELTQNMVGTAAGTVGVSQEDIPLAMRMAGASPGFATAAAFMTYRGSNTLLEGGRFDYLSSTRKARRVQTKYRVLDEAGNITDPNVRQFFGGGRGGLLGRRAARKVTETGTGIGQTFNARASAASFRPRAFRRHGSLSSFADPSMGVYSPYSLGTSIGNFGPTKKFISNKLGLGTLPEGQSAFGPGLLSFLSAGTRIDRLERKALAGNAKALSKLGRVDQNILSLARVNNPAMLAPTFGSTGARSISYSQAVAMTSAERGGLTASQYAARFKPPKATVSTFMDDAMGQTVGRAMGPVGPAGQMPMVGTVGVRGNLMASSAPTVGLQKTLGFFRGIGGFAEAGGLQGAAREGAVKAVSFAGEAFSKAGLTNYATKEAAQTVLESGLYKTLGRKGIQQLALKGGAKGAGLLGARVASLAIPGLQVVGAISLLYDLGNMAGQVVKSGINLARDAAKSIQGSINKPLFGMGYRDTEAAATSRMRGVMAIQNSRLNARSMLGSEAGMLAAHYG